MMKISFIGLGKLGLPLATTLAKNKNQIIAIDKNEDLIKKLNAGHSPWIEDQLQKNIDESSKFIQYTTDYSKVSNTEISIILVNTPSNKKDGSFSNLFVEQSIYSICEELKKANKKNHMFILSSTVMPTSIKNDFIPLIENLMGWKLNKEFGFCYIPDFVAIGKIIEDFENPDFLLIGQSNEQYGDIAERIYKTIIKNNAEICRASLAEAEICKVSLNAYMTTKISFANYLGLLCNKVDKTIDVDRVTSIIGKDSRIGSRYFKSGNSYGGTCFPRDTWAFMKVSERVGLISYQMEANEKINDMVDNEVILNLLREDITKIGLIGLGFKPGTSVITEGLAHKIIKRLKNRNFEFYLYDNYKESYDNIMKETDENLHICYSIEQLINKSDIIVYCNGDSTYEKLVTNKPKIDPWRINKKQ
jgi:UDPglucose 6-dehydrogenase